MSSPRSIRQLAREAGEPVNEALARLQSAGLRQRSVSDRVAESDIGRARLALGLLPSGFRNTAGRGIGTASDAQHAEGFSDIKVPEQETPAPQHTTPDDAGLQSADSPQLSKDMRPTATAGEANGGPEQSRRKQRPSTPKGPLRHHYELPLIGNPDPEINYLTLPEIRAVRKQLEQDYAKGSDPMDAGERDRGTILEAAVARPHTSAGNRLKYPTIEMASAALLHALVQDHPFLDGNKRTGIVSCLVFLDKNNYVFEGLDTDLFETTVALAKHELVGEERRSPEYDDKEMEALARWIKKKCRRIARGTKNMKWKALSKILRSYGCQFERRQGNKIVIRRDVHQTNVGARNDGEEMDRSTVQKIRKDLLLLEEHGVDEEVFFYGAPRIKGFINKYRKTLDDLAAFDRHA